jgi:hypothetical protein
MGSWWQRRVSEGVRIEGGPAKVGLEFDERRNRVIA